MIPRGGSQALYQIAACSAWAVWASHLILSSRCTWGSHLPGSLTLTQSSISERKETLPPGREGSPPHPQPNQELRYSGRTTSLFLHTAVGVGACRLSFPRYPHPLPMAQAPCLEKNLTEKTSNCQQDSGQVRNLSQERPLACLQGPGNTAPRHHSPEVPRPHFHWGISRAEGGHSSRAATQRQTRRQSQGQHLLQDERQSLLPRPSSPHQPHPFLIQQAEGKGAAATR